jgi:putative flippase GtrA
MTPFVRFIEFLVAISVGISAVSNYLIVNKLWTRKNRREVAESVSISAALLGLATGVPFFIEFTLVSRNLPSAIKTVIGIATGTVFVLVGTGIWVAENRGTGFVRLFIRALKLEKKESADLIKALAQPHGARELMAVFHAMALVDKHVDERELEMIRLFAQRWRVQLPDLLVGHHEGGGDLIQLRRSVEEYLAVSPPAEQAQELLDVLHLFVQADEQVTHDEELVLEEIEGMIREYVGGGESAADMHEVVIVPQDESQLEAVRALLPGVEPKIVRGGRVFSVGRFFSPRYADMVSEKYINLGLFTARVQGAGR